MVSFDYTAQEVLRAQNVVYENSTYKAGTSIILEPNFQAKIGSTFEALIEPCTPANVNSPETAVRSAFANSIVLASPTMQLKVFPNPATTRTAIQYHLTIAGYCQIRLIDLQGRIQLSKQQFNSQGWETLEITTSELSKGIYFLHLIAEEGVISQRLLIHN